MPRCFKMKKTVTYNKEPATSKSNYILMRRLILVGGFCFVSNCQVLFPFFSYFKDYKNYMIFDDYRIMNETFENNNTLLLSTHLSNATPPHLSTAHHLSTHKQAKKQ
jgi:hypothetical protein